MWPAILQFVLGAIALWVGTAILTASLWSAVMSRINKTPPQKGAKMSRTIKAGSVIPGMLIHLDGPKFRKVETVYPYNKVAGILEPSSCGPGFVHINRQFCFDVHADVEVQ